MWQPFDLKMTILALAGLFFSLASFAQPNYSSSYSEAYYKEYVTEIAIEMVSPSTVTESYIYDFDADGNPLFLERKVLPFNDGISPVLMDSVSFYALRDSLIADTNLVFLEMKITDFDDMRCYACDTLINIDYDYQVTRYRTLYGTLSDESLIRLEKFIYLFVGQVKGVYFLHALMGTKREF
jgi:hypothetical protein